MTSYLILLVTIHLSYTVLSYSESFVESRQF